MDPRNRTEQEMGPADDRAEDLAPEDERIDDDDEEALGRPVQLDP
jgi:hypothetical protein